MGGLIIKLPPWPRRRKPACQAILSVKYESLSFTLARALAVLNPFILLNPIHQLMHALRRFHGK